MEKKSAVREIAIDVMSNAVWALAGGAVISFVQAIIQRFHHQSVDWCGTLQAAEKLFLEGHGFSRATNFSCVTRV